MPLRNATPVTGKVTGGASDTLGCLLCPNPTTNRPARQAPAANLAHALRLAIDLGWPVLPVDGKKPANGLAYSDASSDPETLGELFTGRVTGIGARMGGALRLVAPEIDHKNGGTVETFYKLAGVRMGDYKTPTMRTGNGWRMICYVPSDEDCNFGNLELDGHGLAVMGNGGQVVLPPSIHPNGKRYQWVPGLEPWNVDVAPCPSGILDRIRAKTAHNRPQPAQNGRTEAQPAQPGQYDAATVKGMLDVLKPWQDGYNWWLSILMAVHSALGDDGLALAENWGEGKPGEVAAKWGTFDAAGGVTIATLAYHAQKAGWVPPAAPDETDLPPAWRITADDWRSCPACAALHTAVMSDGSVSTHHKWCRRPACPVYRKVKARDALRCVFSWPGVQTETVQAADWRRWRKTANLAHGDNWRAVPLPDGARLALFAVEAGGLDVDRVLDLAVSAILENETARRDRRRARAFLESLPVDHPLPPAQLEAMKAALDVLAQPAGGNVSRPRRKRSDGPAPQPPAARAKPVETILVSSFRQRRAVLDVLNRLNIPWERRAYGGWATEPLDPGQLVQLKTALVFGVPGARVLSGALEAGSYAELSTAPPPPALFVTARDARIANLKHGRRALKTEAVPIY